jgi:hypothetical protein
MAAHSGGAQERMSCVKTFVNRGGYVGQAGWQANVDGGFTGSTEARSIGEAVLTCTAKLSDPEKELVLDFRGAHVSFADAPTGLDGAGLVVEAAGCTLKALRIAGEDWAELGAARYRISYAQPVSAATVVFRLIDISDVDALRADLNQFTLRARKSSEDVRECP